MSSVPPPVECPTECPIFFVDMLAEYMQKQYHFCLKPFHSAEAVIPNIQIPLPVVAEADCIAGLLVKARRNPVVLPDFDITQEALYARRFISELRQEIAENNDDPSYAYPVLETPSILVDSQKNVIAWYLPALLSKNNQEQIWEYSHYLRESLHSSLKHSVDTEPWRTHSLYYRENVELRGSLNISPGWFHQGYNHENSNITVSTNLRDPETGGECKTWLTAMYEAQALLSATLSIIHPKLYALGRESIVHLWKAAAVAKNKEMQDALRSWPSVYNSLSIMVNRCSLYHVDMNGKVEWFDQLLTVGHYKDLDMVFPRQRCRLRYDAGTLIAFSGRLLVHGVGDIDGDRACVAWYMQRKVHAAFDIPQCHYATL